MRECNLNSGAAKVEGREMEREKRRRAEREIEVESREQREREVESSEQRYG